MPGHNEDNIFFIGDFDDELERTTIVPLAQEIKRQAKVKDGRIDLHINSCGGYVHLVQHIIELVEQAKRNDIVVRTIVPSMAFSAGSMLAITGTPGERYIARGAEHLVHYGQIMSFETTPTQVERFRQWKERAFKANLTHYKKYAEIPNLEENIQDDGWFVPARDCIKYKMADKYLEKMEL